VARSCVATSRRPCYNYTSSAPALLMASSLRTAPHLPDVGAPPSLGPSSRPPIRLRPLVVSFEHLEHLDSLLGRDDTLHSALCLALSACLSACLYADVASVPIMVLPQSPQSPQSPQPDHRFTKRMRSQPSPPARLRRVRRSWGWDGEVELLARERAEYLVARCERRLGSGSEFCGGRVRSDHSSQTGRATNLRR
jgi:hypothetical protein